MNSGGQHQTNFTQMNDDSITQMLTFWMAPSKQSSLFGIRIEIHHIVNKQMK